MLGTLEIIALITIGIALLKIITLMINPKSWFGSTKKLFVNIKAAQLVSLVLAAVLLYYLLGAGVTIVQIFAVMLFVMMLVAMALAPYVSALIKAVKPKEVLTGYFNPLVLLVWLALMAWGLYAIFA